MTPLDALRLQVAAMRIQADQLEEQADLVKDASETEDELMAAVKLASDCLALNRAALLIEELCDRLEAKPLAKARGRAKGLRVVQ